MALGCPFTLNDTTIFKPYPFTSYGCLVREINMNSKLTPELGRRKRPAWGAHNNIDGVVKKTRKTRLRTHLLNITVLPDLSYASETSDLRKQEENAVSVIERHRNKLGRIRDVLQRLPLDKSLEPLSSTGC
ncbi:hypothetical protein RB195_014441 [Necator americanus]|uniref:BHLH domain-containing protein n=1 Tax=Necator americanus TaxID=51031 RepID=A0ABR1E053_NECAM